MEYAFKDGAKINGDPKVVAAALLAVREKYSDLTPNAVVAEASNPDHELHRYFEWDDSEAARQYRLEQARRLIRCVVEVRSESDVRPRAFHLTVTKDEGRRVYTPIEEVLADPDMTRQVVGDVRMALAALRRKLEGLEHVSRLVDAIKLAETEAEAVVDAEGVSPPARRAAHRPSLGHTTTRSL